MPTDMIKIICIIRLFGFFPLLLLYICVGRCGRPDIKMIYNVNWVEQMKGEFMSVIDVDLVINTWAH